MVVLSDKHRFTCNYQSLSLDISLVINRKESISKLSTEDQFSVKLNVNNDRYRKGT